MPIRVYDIAKKLGVESKYVLAIAKELGIKEAKVPSSALDRITGEFLEEKLKANPESTTNLRQKPVSTVASQSSPSQTIIVRTGVNSPSPVPPESTKSDNRFANSRILQQILSRLQGQAAGKSYSPKGFESDVNCLLNDLFPFSVLPGIRLFSSEPRGKIDYGFEIDNLIHLRHEGIDYVIEVEAKHQPVRVDKQKWLVQYESGPKCACEQLENHIRTMWEYLRPIARQTELKFLAIVVSSEIQTARHRAAGYRNAELHLCSIKDLPALLAERFNFGYSQHIPISDVLRVPQSRFLDLFRLSLPVEQLGHPELSSAIRYVDRCRRTLDVTLFQKFAPTPSRWVINGSAGMGKSVLLAYTAAVLSSGFEIHRALGENNLKKATETFSKIGFDSDPKRGSIVIMAMSAKQLENIRGWFNLFVEQFQQADVAGDVRFRQPEFRLCRPGESLSDLAYQCSALLVDEAHDIPSFAAHELAELNMKSGIYLVVACDRHQKLRLTGLNAKIIEGLDFTNRSTLLRQVYRNPAPIYIASLALMFRWFASDGPKVIPTASQLDVQFGFDSKSLENGIEVQMRSDAHPANSWCHTVASFPNADAAYSALIKENLSHKSVLWVRFSEEDPDFDYEQLIQHFTYHNCRSHDAHKISDKYIKGQDYPIVVVEGFPGFMDRFESSTEVSTEIVESRAWAFRRELYLCASRATSFLYFICNVPETPEILRIREEIQRLVTATAMPEDYRSGGTKSWRFAIQRTAETRKLDVFSEASSVTQAESGPKPVPIVSVSVKSQTNVGAAKQPLAVRENEGAIKAKASLASIALDVVAQSPLSTPPSPKPVEKTSKAPMHPIEDIPLLKLPQSVLAKPDNPSTPQPSNAPDPAENSLGDVTTLSHVAKFLQKDVAQVIDAMARRGLPNVQASSRVNVKFVVSLFAKASSAPPTALLLKHGSPMPQPIQKSLPPPDSAALPEKFASADGVDTAPSSSIKSTDEKASKSLENPPFTTLEMRVLELPEQMTVKELADALNRKPFQIVAQLMKEEIFANVNQQINWELISKVAARCGYAAKKMT